MAQGQYIAIKIHIKKTLRQKKTFWASENDFEDLNSGIYVTFYIEQES